MGKIFAFLFIFLWFFPFFRFLCIYSPRIIIGIFPDLFKWIKYKRWNECNAYGRIICFTGLFGQGKTKECVRFITRQYEHFNGKPVYDFQSNKWVTQQIVVYSNVDLLIPYVKLTSLQQLVDCQGSDPGVVNLFLIDEASVEFNSREFKNNFSTPALNTILTSRHHKIGIYLTSQRFGHMDALLRQVTSAVYECHYFKPLRIQKISVYDAWEVENCSNLLMVKPLRVMYFYTTDEVYENYDTYAMVDDISKKCKKHDFVSDTEVITKQGAANNDYHLINNVRHSYKKRVNK